MLKNTFPISTAEDLLAAVYKERQEYNIRIIDEQFDELAKSLGRQLTESEQEAVLDIADEYTPKDADGMYLYPLIPFDYAWQIYQINNDIS